jgi:hypothetical protein
MHPNTIVNWVKRDGLPALTDQRPHLVLGRDLIAFLGNKSASRQQLRPGEFFCLGCKAPRRPAGGMLEDISIGCGSANLRAICPCCSGLMHRRVARSKLEDFCRAVADSTV